MPLVSILIPCYNAGKYIAETLQSVLNQTYTNWECIIVDDHSTDNSVETITAFTVKHPNKIKLIKNPRKGACAARNYAFAESKGEYIQYLDADDLLSPNKIERQIDLLRNQEKTIASCSWSYFQDKLDDTPTPNQFIDKDYSLPIDWLIDSWNGKGMAQTSVWLTPRNLIEKVGIWNEDLKINQDGEFFCRVLLRTKKIAYCKEAKVYYRIGQPDSVSRTSSQEKLSSQLQSFNLYKQHITNHNLESSQTLYALVCVFSDFYIRTLIPYPDLANQALKTIQEMGFNKPIPQGGRTFKLLSKFIGLIPAIKLRSYLNHP